MAFALFIVLSIAVLALLVKAGGKGAVAMPGNRVASFDAVALHRGRSIQ
jgi:hypothetical protein